MRKPIKFGKYLLLERIAVGGMAEVFVAKTFGVAGFERLVAIKKILPTMGEDAEFINMFVDEARIAVQLSHANIVQVLELGKNEENLYIAMEYVCGRDLRQLLERFRKRGQPMPMPQACRIVAEVCEALDYAHRKRDAAGRPLGIVHRDVSPQNVLVSFEGEVKLIDFGIAKAESRLQKTQAGILKGKFSYMSPEQVKGLAVDSRSDIFACGVLLWELLCGEKLFAGDSDLAILEKVRSAVLPQPRNCPEELTKVMFKALAADPTQRYQTASALHDDLVRFAVQGKSALGARQLAQWLREEFRSDWEREQQRLRGWLDSGSEDVTPVDPPGPSAAPWRIAADKDTLAMPPRPADAHELPTMKMEQAALAQAEKRFDVSAEGTRARRNLRTTPMARPPTPQKKIFFSRAFIAAGLGVGALAAAGIAFIVIPAPVAPPGKIIISPSPSVTADLVIDGRPSGQLPPFVHTVAAGPHRIEVKADGYKPFTRMVQIPPGGRPVEIEAQLVADGPVQVEGAVVASAPHRTPVAAHKPASAADKRKEDAPPPPVAVAGPVPPIVAPVAAAPAAAPIGYLVASTRPAARVSIDGQDTGRWTPVPPANPISLPAGGHALVFETADGRRLEETIQIEAGKTARMVRSVP